LISPIAPPTTTGGSVREDAAQNGPSYAIAPPIARPRPSPIGSPACGTLGPGLRSLRVRRLALGNPGDVKPVGEGVSELRIHYGPGYRIYYVQRGNVLVVLLCGGDKDSQGKDIALALTLAKEV
jgi:putative addiction module killer protein